MKPRAFAQAVKLRNSTTPVADADNTTTIPGTPGPWVDSVADLWQLNVQQRVTEGDVVLADWKGIHPPTDPITAGTEVLEVASGALYRVHGQPELMRSLRTNEPDHIAVRLKYISDQQGAPS